MRGTLSTSQDSEPFRLEAHVLRFVGENALTNGAENRRSCDLCRCKYFVTASGQPQRLFLSPLGVLLSCKPACDCSELMRSNSSGAANYKFLPDQQLYPLL